ncbi:unnamed protein product [Ceutorhynchus assimilis]|uniref:Uncharacterized protein n=1 Tax=Ceutorhynchus assimilis TaxID=467358 RepID=A0A9N9QIJ2_9CUCU|nr:unnamed protein product [Ceutorhynchus assimilis]
MINLRTIMILIACGLILQNVIPVKGQGLLDILLIPVELVLDVPKVILELSGPLTGPAVKALKEILGTASKGLPLNQDQVQNLLKILDVDSILDLGDSGLDKLSSVLDVDQILDVEGLLDGDS